MLLQKITESLAVCFATTVKHHFSGGSCPSNPCVFKALGETLRGTLMYGSCYMEIGRGVNEVIAPITVSTGCFPLTWDSINERVWRFWALLVHDMCHMRNRTVLG